MGKNKIYWDYETCYNEARKYNTFSDFIKSSPCAYASAKRKGWISEYTWLEKTKSRPRVYWNNYEKCYEEACKYEYKSDFAKGSKSAYAVSCKNGWINDFNWWKDGLKRGTDKHIKWNAETCRREALKYNSRNEFKHGNNSAYNVARKNGWIDDYDWLIPQLEIWTYEKCLEIAQQCVTKADFKKANSKAYQAASHNGWMDKFDWLLDGRYFDSNGKKKEKSKRGPNKALESKRKSHCVYAYEFDDHAVYVGLTMIRRIKGRDYEHIFSNDSVSKYALENNVQIPEMKVILSDLTPLEARNKEGEILEEYVKKGWKALNKTKTGSLGSYMHGYWTKERCMEEGRKYNTINEYQKGNPSSYYAARVNEWLKDFTWFEHRTNPSGYWNYDHCKEEALKYERLSDFRNKSQRAYQVAKEKGWIKEYDWLKRILSPKGYWDDYDNCKKEAEKYDSRISFYRGSHAAYESARKHHWLDDFTWFKFKKQKPKGYWTYETCRGESKKYRSRTEFSDKCNRAYLVSTINGRINDFTWLNGNIGQLDLFD